MWQTNTLQISVWMLFRDAKMGRLEIKKQKKHCRVWKKVGNWEKAQPFSSKILEVKREIGRNTALEVLGDQSGDNFAGEDTKKITSAGPDSERCSSTYKSLTKEPMMSKAFQWSSVTTTANLRWSHLTTRILTVKPTMKTLRYLPQVRRNVSKLLSSVSVRVGLH